MRRSILRYPHALLTEKAQPIERITPAVRQLLDDMLETMYAAGGIGLAAPQIGVPLRAIVVDARPRGINEPIAIINPEILERTGVVRSLEGCLSLPGCSAEVLRGHAVVVRGRNRDGAWMRWTARGLTARCLQHEIDHLDGVTIADLAVTAATIRG